MPATAYPAPKTTTKGKARTEERAVVTPATKPIFNKTTWTDLQGMEVSFAGLFKTPKPSGLGLAIISCVALASAAGEKLNAREIAARLNQHHRKVSMRLKNMTRTGLLATTRERGFPVYSLGTPAQDLWSIIQNRVAV